MYATPVLRPLTRLLASRLPGCTHAWGRALAWVLTTRAIITSPLPRRTSGFTNPFFPVILVDRKLVRQLDELYTARSEAGDGTPFVELTEAGRIANPLDCTVAQLILHEAAHQLWAVWPEWRRWFGLKRIYGPGINAADAISEAVCRELCAFTKYPGMQLDYRSPLHIFGPRFRR